MIVICESASLASLLQPPSRASFKGTKKSFCIGGEKDSHDSQTRNGPSTVGTSQTKKAAEARGNSGGWRLTFFQLSEFEGGG